MKGTRVTWQPPKLRYSHEDCIDFLIANPAATRREIAERYGKTETWVTLVTNSDLFRARHAARRADLIDPELAATIRDRFAAVAARGAEVLLDKLSKPADEVSDQLALGAAGLGAKAMGLGQPAAPAVGAGKADLEDLAGRLISFVKSTRNGEPIDVQVREVRPEAPHPVGANSAA